MDQNKIVPFIQQSLSLGDARFKVLKEGEKQIILYDEVNKVYFDIQPTNCVSNFQTSENFGFGVALTYEKSRGLRRNIGMIDTGKILTDEVCFTEGDYTATFIASKKMDTFEHGEEEKLFELVSMDTNEVTQAGGYYLAVNPNQDYFDICLKRGGDILYTEHRAKNYEKNFECNTIKVKKKIKNGSNYLGNHVDTTIATEGNCRFYRMTYKGKDGEPNYCSYFVSSVYDNLEGFEEWAPYQFSDVENPYKILLKDTDIKKEEIISYLSVMKWNPDHIRFTVFKLKDQFVINIRDVSGLQSTRIPVMHSSAIDSDEIERIKEYLETIIQDSIFLGIINQELDKLSEYLGQGLGKNTDIVDTFSTESLFYQGIEETKLLICRENTSVIEQLLKKKNSFGLRNQKEKMKEYQ